jgi:N-acetylglucosaminyl-diphospho-decaprenol L-rhamnosyltransferase
MNTPNDLTILIVSWNVREYLAACLDSIHNSLNASGSSTNLTTQILIVDSASSDGTVEILRESYTSRNPQIEVLAQSENVGFTRGNNIGLQAARGRYVLLLNPDTVILGDALSQLVAYMDAHPDIGIVGPHTLNTDGSHQSTRRRFPTLVTGVFESTWLQPFAPKRVLERFYALDIPDEAVADVDWVQGSALMLRHSVYEQIGGLDEQYTMFSEELDWSKRAKQAGWRVVYLGTARIVHHGGKSTEQVAAHKHIYFQQSKIRYFRKFHGALAASVVRLVLVALYVQQLALEAAKGAVGIKRTLRRDRVRIYWQVIRALTGV